MAKNLFSFLRLWKNPDMSIICPECKGRMDIKEIGSDSIFEYYEVKRKYKCRKCGKEYDSLELIVLNGKIQSLTDQLNKLYDSIDTFYSALLNLQKTAKKLNEAKKDIYDGPVMN